MTQWLGLPWGKPSPGGIQKSQMRSKESGKKGSGLLAAGCTYAVAWG